MTSDEILKAIQRELERTREAKRATLSPVDQVEEECADLAFTEALENLFETVDNLFD